MLRGLLDVLTRLAAWSHRRQRIVPRTPLVKVNLGSGLAVADGWINIDSSLNSLVAKWPALALRQLYRVAASRNWYSPDEYLRTLKGHYFVHHNFAYGIPLPDCSVDFAYSSHFLEHLPKAVGEALIREAYRVLKPSGTIRIAVPDLELAVGEYQKGNKERALDFLYEWSSSGHFNKHQYMYDFGLLEALLHGAGFTQVERCAFRQGRTPDILQLDNRADETLFVEARK